MPRPRLYQSLAEKKAAYRRRKGIAARPRYTSRAAKMAAYRQRKRQPVYFKHGTVEWATPPDLFAALDAEFHFTLDVCATPANATCARFYTRQQDALRQPWEGVCWCNPPYGPEIPRFIEKAARSAQQGATVVCLVPARTDTRWWHAWVLPAAEVRWLQGRLKFNGSATSAPFPSALAIFRPAPGSF